MSRVSSTYKPKQAVVSVPKPDSVNMERFPAFAKSPKTMILQCMMTGTLGNTFYASEQDNQKEAVDLIVLGVSKYPDFMAKAAVYARNKGFMRSLPIMALAYLMAASNRFDDYLDRIVLTPNDLRDFMVVFGSLRKGQGGRHFKRVVGEWLSTKLTPYWIIKYGSEGKEGYSLKDMLITIHPHGVNPGLAQYIIKDTLPEDPQIRSFEYFKKSSSEEEALKWAKEGRLPFEVISSFAGAWPKIWESIALNAPIQNTMKNLVTLHKHGVLDKFRQQIFDRMTDGDSISYAKLLPYQVWRAFEKCRDENLPQWVTDMLRVMFDKSVANVKVLPGKTLVAIDTSGSMRSHPVQDAAMLGLTVARATDADMITFDTSVKVRQVSKIDSILTQVERMIREFSGGGTATSVVADYMMKRADLKDKNRVVYDVVWVFTDAQQNTYGGSEGLYDFIQRLTQFRKQFNPKCKFIEVNISNYMKSGDLAPEGGLNWLCVGSSVKIIDTITMAIESGESMVDEVEGYSDVPF